jgi:hypothetical protein
VRASGVPQEVLSSGKPAFGELTIVWPDGARRSRPVKRAARCIRMARLPSVLLSASLALVACRERPVPELIALSGGLAVSAIAPAGDDVYWSSMTFGVDACTGTLYRTNVRSHETTLVGEGCISAIAVVGDSVWWSASAVGVFSGELRSMPRAGGPPLLHASGERFEGLAFDAANVYVGTDSSGGADPGGAQIVAYPRDGGVPAVVETVVTPPPLLAVSGGSLFWLGPTFQPQGAKFEQSINRASVGGGAPEIFVAGRAPTSFAVDSANLYWTDVDPSDSSAGALMKLPLAAGKPVTLASGFPNPDKLLVAGDDVYWLTSVGNVGTILRTSVSGGPVETVEGGLVFGNVCFSGGSCGLPTPLAVDDTYIYYAAGAGVHRLRR